MVVNVHQTVQFVIYMGILYLHSDIFLTDIMGCDRLNLVKYTHNEILRTPPIVDKMSTATVICILVTFCYYLLERGFLLFLLSVTI